MLNCKPELVNALKDILPTYYELFCDSETPTPCITYRENSNNDYSVSNEYGYSTLSWHIKIWGHTVDDITTYAEQVDSTLRAMGYSRQSSNELVNGNQICKAMIYTGLGFEYYS